MAISASYTRLGLHIMMRRNLNFTQKYNEIKKIFNILKQNTLNKLRLKNHKMQCRYEQFDFTGDCDVHYYFLKDHVCLWSPERVSHSRKSSHLIQSSVMLYMRTYLISRCCVSVCPYATAWLTSSFPLICGDTPALSFGLSFRIKPCILYKCSRSSVYHKTNEYELLYISVKKKKKKV